MSSSFQGCSLGCFKGKPPGETTIFEAMLGVLLYSGALMLGNLIQLFISDEAAALEDRLWVPRQTLRELGFRILCTDTSSPRSIILNLGLFLIGGQSPDRGILSGAWLEEMRCLFSFCDAKSPSKCDTSSK